MGNCIYAKHMSLQLDLKIHLIFLKLEKDSKGKKETGSRGKAMHLFFVCLRERFKGRVEGPRNLKLKVGNKANAITFFEKYSKQEMQ